MSSSIKVQNLNFFNTPTECLEDYRKVHWVKKALSIIKHLGTFFLHGITKLCSMFKKIDKQYTEAPPAGFTKQKLVVCLHGLNNGPAHFSQIIDVMKKKKNFNETDLYVPAIQAKGNAKLTSMVGPIFEQIKKWAEQETKDKELVLVGISNGGRIARAIETELLKSERTKQVRFRFVSVVGACKGSTMANLAKRLGFGFLLSKNIAEEMPTISERNKTLSAEWEEELKHASETDREYTFIASPHDWVVPNYDSTLMEVPGGRHRTHYALMQGHGHNSIVNAAAPAVADIVFGVS